MITDSVMLNGIIIVDHLSINEMITDSVVLNGIIIVVSNNKIASTSNGVLGKIIRNRRLFNDICLPNQMRIVILIIIIVEIIIWIIIDHGVSWILVNNIITDRTR